MWAAQADQVIAAVAGRSDAHIVGIERGTRLLDRLGRERRVIAADEHDALETFFEVVFECERQRITETTGALFDQLDLARYDCLQRRRGAAWVDHARALPAKLQTQLDCVEQKRAVQRGGFFGREKRHQAGLREPRLRCLSEYDQRARGQ